MTIKAGLIPMLLLAAVASACVVVRYSFNGQPYSSASSMLAAQRQYQAEALSRVEPRSRVLALNCRVVVPNREVVRNNGVLSDGELPHAAQDALTEGQYNDDIFLAEIIGKRHICQTLAVEIGDGKRVLPRGNELLVYLHMPELATLDWYVQRAGQQRILVPFDNRILDNQQRIRDWLLRLEAKIVLLDAPK